MGLATVIIREWHDWTNRSCYWGSASWL